MRTADRGIGCGGRHVTPRTNARNGCTDHREDGQPTEHAERLQCRAADPRRPSEQPEHEEGGAHRDPDDRGQSEEPFEFRPEERVCGDTAGDGTDHAVVAAHDADVEPTEEAEQRDDADDRVERDDGRDSAGCEQPPTTGPMLPPT